MTEQQQDFRGIDKPRITSEIIEKSLDCVGTEAKKLIMKHIEEKYGMDFAYLGEYKTEFQNYLRETFYESAEIIIAQIRSTLEDATVSKTIRAKRIQRSAKNVHFLFCDNCLWSASVLASSFELRCMACSTELKCAMPISENESFTFEVSDKRGITMSFT